MDFLIQRVKNQIVHDFSFVLLESFKYHKWKNNSIEFDYIFTNNKKPKWVSTEFKNYVPIGSVEFVSYYLEVYYGKKVTPKNVPVELFDHKFTQRNVFNGTERDLTGRGKKFVKSNDKIKLFTEIVNDDFELKPGNYQISDVIKNIDSEWRCFVYHNKLVGLQNYCGEFTLFPDVADINMMIYAYKDAAPVAYTLDVGINDKGTFIIEVHDFFSCGLYGFSDLVNLPYMFDRWFKEYITS